MSMLYTYRMLAEAHEMLRAGKFYGGFVDLPPPLNLDKAIQQFRSAEQAVDQARALIVKWEQDIAGSEDAMKLLFDNLTPEEQAMLVEEKLKEEQ